MPRRVIGYARVSSEEQARGTSLEDQQTAIRAYAKDRGLTVHRLYVEAVSAVREKIETREQMQALMKDVRSGDLVLCDKLDRWSRDPEFTYASVRQILAAGASFYAISDRCDPSTSEGDTTLGFRILFAREEHKRIKERMVGTRRLLRDQGFYVEGRVPLGYVRRAVKGQRAVDKNVLLIDEAGAELVRRIFRMAIAGNSFIRISEAIDRHPCFVKECLERRLYTGEIQNSHGEWIVGKQPAIIDVATYLKARDALTRRRVGGHRAAGHMGRTAGWILRDVAVCGHCGAGMMSAWGGTGLGYYRCAKRCVREYVLVESVEEPAAEMVLARLGELRAELAATPKRVPVVDTSAKVARLQRKREKLLDAYTDGIMTREELRTRLEKVDVERMRLTAQPRTVDVGERRRMFAEVVALEAAWTRASGPIRRAIVKQLVEQAEVAKDEAPRLVWRATEDLSAEE